ncbi:MAG: acyl-CoA/acyl-ACP dehydrogenase [Myxococcales bacterium]|nr:acyl-CoA/acyl-ACP dehydrogenase [Myxococcales bacterium]
MIDFTPDPMQQQLIETARKFGRDHVAPAEIALDKIGDPKETFAADAYWSVLAQACELGFHKMGIMEEYGGLGLDAQSIGLVWEELAFHGAGFTASLIASSVAQQLITVMASHNKELIDQYVLPFCADRTGRKFSAWGSSEPNVGSDGKNYYDPNVRHHTTAVKKDGGWSISGTKSDFVSNAGIADVFVIFANVDPALGIRGSGAFIVPADAPGVQRGLPIDKLGLRVLNQAALYFEDVWIPEGNMIFPPGEGFPMLHQMIITVGSLAVGYLAVGLMRAAYQEALEYSKVRVQWGKPIFEHQLVARKLFECYQTIEAARALLWKASWLARTRFPGDLKASLAGRIFATDNAIRHTAEMVQVLGGYGISKEYKLEKYLRDAKLLQIMDGTNETLMMKAAAQL